MVSVAVSLAVGFVLCAVVIYARTSSRGRPFPGPQPVPIFGNALQLPQKKLWEKLYEWGTAFGPIYSFRLFFTRILVLNTAEAGRELLEGKSMMYANRPLPKMIEMTGFDKGVVLEHDPNRLRHARKMLHTVMQPRQLSEYREILEHHVNVLLYNLMQSPDDFVQHFRHLTAGITMEISHGHRVISQDDPYVKKANVFADNFAEASLPNNHIVDWIPILAKLPSFLPGMGFKEKARAFREQYFSLAEEGHQKVKDEIAKGTARPSLTYRALTDEKDEIPDDVIMFTATQVYTGGADTSVSTLSSFFLFMVKFPEVLKKAQEEVDRVVGSDRLPVYADKANLKFTEAIMLEVLRLRPPVSLVTRLAGQDDVHNGYLVEKDTILLVNFWGMLRDEEHYPDPHSFKPDRWLSGVRNDAISPVNVAFGFGRRICPGKHLAEEMIFTSMARILAHFDISPALDSSGKPIIPSDDSTNGGITFPMPFRCSVRPRSQRSKETLEGLATQQAS